MIHSQAQQAPMPATETLWRCGGRQCPAGECDHEDDELHRHASGAGPAYAPPIVRRVLDSAGAPLPTGVRHDMEQRLGSGFADVRIHTDATAGRSARAVSAHAWTVGRHIAFAPGSYDPASAAGQRLLAHELSHAAQYAAGSRPGTGRLRVSSPDEAGEQHAETASSRAVPDRTPTTIWRRWDRTSPGDCTVDGERYLVKVVVDQEKAQSVTLHWDDGSVESGMCSTGKGHCCVDSDDQVAGSVTESRRDGSNLTPITSGAGHVITDRYRTGMGWPFWSMIVPARAIGLHQHDTVTGTPLSHGCVRMHPETAKRIFCGARQNKTRVEVRGFARPDCAEPELQREWRRDFVSAGWPTDGDRPDSAAVRNRRETRRMLKEAYGRELSDAEIVQGEDEKLALPRCRSRAAEPSTEERRAVPTSGAQTGVPTVSTQLLASSGLEALIPALSGRLAATRTTAQAVAAARAAGRDLWSKATTAAGDDRPLSWARLAMTRTIRQWEPGFRLSDTDRQRILTVFEDGSRGIDDIAFTGGRDTKKILVSGFDPFGFDSSTYGRTAASNPSGAAALALDGRTIRNGGIEANVQAVVFPVRYADFDAGLVERVIRPHLSGSAAVDMVMTISMGAAGSGFEVEEYAGRRRSASASDNADATASGSMASPTEPPGLAAGPEFLRTSLPASARRSLGRTAPNEEERELTEIRAGETKPRRSTSGPTAGSRSVEGSGGGFLSNEIFYRVALMRRTDGSTVPVGHLHTPFLSPGTGDRPAAGFAGRRQTIVDGVRRIIEATLPDL